MTLPILDHLVAHEWIGGIALSYDYLKRMSITHSEYYVLLLFSITGMILMSMSAI